MRSLRDRTTFPDLVGAVGLVRSLRDRTTFPRKLGQANS